LFDSIFDARSNVTGPTVLRRGRHTLRVLVTDAAIHERLSKTVRFRAC
jgi:hypothetical protein